MKNSTSRAYSSTYNPEILVEDAEIDTPSPIIHPMGKKTTKRKRRAKESG